MGLSLRLVVVALVAVVAILATVISLVPVQRAGFKAVRDTAQLLRFEVRERLAVQIEIFFTSPMGGIDAFNTMNRLNMITPMNDYRSIAPPLIALGRQFGLGMYVGLDDTQMFYTSAAAGRCWHAYRHNATQRRSATSFFNENNWTMGAEGAWSVTGYDPTQRPWYPALRAGQGWSPVYVNSGGGSAALTLGGPVMDTTYTTRIGAVATDIVTSTLINWFLTVSVGKTGRAVLLETATQSALGGNWNESATVKLNASIPDGVTSNYRLARLGDYQDSLLRRTIAAVGENDIFFAAAPFAASFGKGLDTVHVDIVNITDPYNLYLRLMIMLPERDFLTDVKKQVDISIGIVVACIVVLMVIAIIITFLLMQPLAALEAKMYASASFEDFGEEESVSLISEVANIQAAYAKMQAELRRVKSFLPKSVLARLEAEDDDDDETVEGSQASTALSGQDPNKRRMTEVGTAKGSTRSSASRKSALYVEKKEVRGLFIDEGLVSKKVTVMSMNLRRFHNLTKDGNWRNGVALQSTFLSSIETLVRRFKGVVDNFQGDHVFVTFNAVTAAISHQTKACHTFLSVLEGIQSNNHFDGMTCGIASGEALVGNIGCDGMKRFCTVGTLFNQCTVLERLCLQTEGCSVLVTPAVANAAQYDVFYVATNVAKLPGTKAPVVLSTLTGKKAAGNDEWMYDMEKDKKGDDSTPINAAFEKYAAGDIVAAKSLCDDLPADHPSTKSLKSFVSLLPDDHAASQGKYYETSYLQ